MPALLEGALNTHRVRAVLMGFLPSHPGYEKLRRALYNYRSLAAAGGWEAVPEGPALKPGDAGERVIHLSRRLSADSALNLLTDAPGAVYDSDVEAAVREFQRRHGLEPDGVAGKATLSALNVPASQRVRQIEANLERWRWLPEDLGERYILVNVADYTLEVVELGRLVLDMKVIVGKPYRHTPVFSDVMTTIVINPTWYVPRRIAIVDKLPLIRKDPNYLKKMGMHVTSGDGAHAKEVDPRTVDWTKIGPKHFPFRLSQAPGPQNALGRVKFLFPNRFNVYLHDTPSRELFGKTERNFSSGCIRIEKPVDMADYLLTNQPGWNPQRVRDTIDSMRETSIHLDRPIPVHLLYWTVFVDGVGDLQFRPDIYSRDEKLIRALSAR
jgi:murein L,D-transpeptidase YcbB/YkuD